MSRTMKPKQHVCKDMALVAVEFRDKPLALAMGSLTDPTTRSILEPSESLSAFPDCFLLETTSVFSVPTLFTVVVYLDQALRHNVPVGAVEELLLHVVVQAGPRRARRVLV